MLPLSPLWTIYLCYSTNSLTHFKPNDSHPYPLKTLKTSTFLMLSREVNLEHWLKMH